MVAPLGFFQSRKVLVLVFLVEPRGAVDALELRVVLVAFPIRARDGEQFERFDLFRRGHMRAAAEIDEVRAQRVFRKNIARALGDQLDFHGLIAIQLQALLLFGVFALVRQVARLNLPHPLLDLFKIVRRKRIGPLEIVIETVLDGRPNSELRFRDQFENRGREKVRGGMPVDFERLGILRRQNLQCGISFERAR